MNKVRIRKAQMTDANAITQILRALGWFDHLNSESYENTKERIARHLSLCHSENSHSVYVAEGSAGEVVGYGAVHCSSCPQQVRPGGRLSLVIT